MLLALILGGVIFFAWFVPIIVFANNHPAEVLLEGSQWAEHQRFQMEAKGLPLPPRGHPTFPPGTSDLLGDGDGHKAIDKERD